MRTDRHSFRSSSHIRPLILGEDGVKQPSASANPGRFVDPGRLTEKKKAAISKTLVELGIGDHESCNLFVRAMEYELNVYREAAADEAETATPQPVRATQPVAAPTTESAELQVIARAATELAALLESLPYEAQDGLLDNLEAQDPMRRGYDQRYLQQMQIETQRLAAARLNGPEAVHKLFEELAPRYEERPGGYTRVLKLGQRQGDGARTALIELVEE